MLPGFVVVYHRPLVRRRWLRDQSRSRLKEEASLAHHQARYLLPSELDAKEPDFHRRSLQWALEAKCEIMELIAGTENEIARSRALMANADRILAERAMLRQSSAR
jgi:hypothetical protein